MDEKILIWEEGVPVPYVAGGLIALDTETEPIVGHMLPPVVCMQAYGPGVVFFMWYTQIDGFLKKLEEVNPGIHYVFHNAPFDLGVTGSAVLMQAAEEDRVHDTYVLDALALVRDEGYIRKDTDLASLARRRLKRTISKDESIRLTFNRKMLQEGISGEHIQYAMEDARTTYDIAVNIGWNSFPTETRKVKMLIALDDMSRRGFFRDEVARAKLEKEFTAEMEESLEILSDWGWYPGQKGNASIFQHVLEGVEQDMGIKFPRTPKSGKIQTTDEALEPIEGDMFIDAYKKVVHFNKILSTYVKDKGETGSDGASHSRFELAATMRTRSSVPNMQNLPRKEGVRGMYIPRPGYLLVGLDYRQVELCGLAESCFRRFGKSRLMELINSGVDCHKYLGTFITGEPIEAIADEIRNLAKVGNFGFPGGLRPSSFASYASGYGVKTTEEMGDQIYSAWMTAFPEMRKHLSPLPDSVNPGMYRTTTWTGFERGNCVSTEIMNSEFQSPTGDGASGMLWRLYREGFRLVNFIHDEVIVELKITTPERIMEEVRRIDRIMVDEMKKVIEHVKIETEAFLMNRWFKEAKQTVDEKGNLKVMVGKGSDGKPEYMNLEEFCSQNKQ